MPRTLVWFRDDLRTHDHPALAAAVDRAEAAGDVLALYVLDERSRGVRPLGGAARWWLHHALASLRRELRDLGIPLLVRRGDPADIVPELAGACAVDGVHWSRRYGGPERTVDARLEAALLCQGIGAESFPGSLLHEPWTVETTTGGPYKVFTPFWRAVRERETEALSGRIAPVGSPRSAGAQLRGGGIRLGEPEELDLLPRNPDWTGGLRSTWDPTEPGARTALGDFLEERISGYHEGREVPARSGTSRLSPYLRFGQIAPHRVWHAVSETAGDRGGSFLSELGWREFCWHLLYHFPHMPSRNLRPEFDRYPWRTRDEDPEAFRAWAHGETGFPLVDAGQRELWETGHMHNRVRMVSASLLVKNLGLDWREGEAWFWDTLVDADPASNPANWQWVAGCGADAAPYFRVFNPERQRERFDPDEAYVRTWVPELGTEAYPAPAVDLGESRREALAHYEAIRNP